MVAATIGNFVEWYDLALYGAFATSIATTFFPQLRNLALHDEGTVTSVLSRGLDMSEASCIDARTQALVRLGALIALDAPVMSYRSHIDAALAAGATVNDIVDTLIAVAPVAGAARLVAAAPAPAAVIGYDLDAAFEAYDNRGLHLTDPQRLDRREGSVRVLRVVARHHLMPRRRDGTDRGPR